MYALAALAASPRPGNFVVVCLWCALRHEPVESTGPDSRCNCQALCDVGHGIALQFAITESTNLAPLLVGALNDYVVPKGWCPHDCWNIAQCVLCFQCQDSCQGKALICC